MTAENVTFTGTVKWAKVYPGMVNKFGKWQVNFYPSTADRKTIQGLKLRNAIKEDEDGFFYIFVKRKDDPMSPGPVVVTDEEGKPFDKPIGNGSEAEITLEIYKWPGRKGTDGNYIEAGTGARLIRVRVTKWVEYKKPVEDKDAWKVSTELPA